jgi:hypothetical protein
MQMTGSEKQKQEKAVKLLQEQMRELFHQLSSKKRQLQQTHTEHAREKLEHAAELAYAPLQSFSSILGLSLMHANVPHVSLQPAWAQQVPHAETETFCM